MIQVEDIAKAYAGQRLFRELSWRIPDGARIGLVGPNGVGKTTLCRLLAGLEEPDAGRISRPRETTVGYLSQEVAGGVGGSVLAAALSGFDEVWRIEYQMEEVAAALSGAPNGAQSDALTARYGDLQHRFEALGGYRLETAAKAILGGLGFRDADFGRPLAEFSGGWRMRAALARLLLLRPALLLLDEPTNHLDIESLEWLEGFLVDYDGTVVLVSHDRYFLNRMVTSIAELGPSGITVYPGDYDDYRVERAALVGPNGAGKSTLLRLLAGVLPLDGGERALGAHVAAHYYAQHQLDALTPTLAVLEELERAAPELGLTRLRTILGAFLFSGDAVDKKIAVLSGGEKARVALAKMLVRPAALLCMDEPTNHLDLAAREVLEEALAGFPGTIVFISHDRYFINRLATTVVEIIRGTLTRHPGNYDDYLAAKSRGALESTPAMKPGRLLRSERRSLGTPPTSSPARREQSQRASRKEASKGGRVTQAVRELRTRLEEVEKQIHALEGRLRELGVALGDPALYADGARARAVTAERRRAEERVAWLLHGGEELAGALAAPV